VTNNLLYVQNDVCNHSTGLKHRAIRFNWHYTTGIIPVDSDNKWQW